MAATTITPRDDGPYQVAGSFELVDATGERFVVEADRPVFLCRCGCSANKPYCDGSQRSSGFASVVRATAPVKSAEG